VHAHATVRDETPEHHDGVAPPDAPDTDDDAAPAPPQGERTVVLQAGGDYILHVRVQNAARFHAELDTQGTEGLDYLTGRLRPVLAHGDVSIFNLETPLATERNPQNTDPPRLCGPAMAARSLANAGFQIAQVANNHAYDQTTTGVGETVAAVEAAGMHPVGGGRGEEAAHAPVIVTTRDGVRVGILAYTQLLNGVPSSLAPTTPQVAVWSEATDLPRVRALREQVDVVVVLFHWGAEFDFGVTAFQRQTGRALCDAGADVVIGTHPHVLQPVARHGECVVAYSLGNLLSNQGLKYRVGYENPDPTRAQGIAETRDTVILRVVLDAPSGSRPRVTRIEAVPLWTENNWLDRFGVPNFENDIFVAPISALRDDPDRQRYLPLYRERVAAMARALGPHAPLVDE
jgi:poly-gamma-glutamate synthesis protein (capsule biosynthesis protein)